MALALQLLPLLLSRALGDPGALLDGRPGDRVNLFCTGVSHPIRWAWAPSFPACNRLSKGRRPILWASSNRTPTVSPHQHFAGRLRALDGGIRRLELLVSSGDSGVFICLGRQENETRTMLQVQGDSAECKAQRPTGGSSYPQILVLLLGTGLTVGLVASGMVWCLYRRSPPQQLPPRPTFALSPLYSSTLECQTPEASKGGAQDSRQPGPGAEPALCRPGSNGPQKIPSVSSSSSC